MCLDLDIIGGRMDVCLGRYIDIGEKMKMIESKD